MRAKFYLIWIALILFVSPYIYSQSPGGVAPAAWYKADASGTLFSDAGILPVANNGTLHQWNSVIGSFPLIQTSNASKPIFSNATKLANFNPTVTFDGSNDWMQSSGVDLIDRADGSVFTAGYMNQQKRSGFTGFHSSMDFPGLHVFSNFKLLFFTSGGPGYQGQSTDLLQPQRYFSAGSAWQNSVGGSASHAAADVSLNGIRTYYATSNINNVNTAAAYRNFRIGADDNYGSFSGELNEILVFENRLSAAQMDQVETYLAVKYGTTYANGTRDYKSASGATVWGATANNGYHNNIAGIAHDDALYQKQSWSTNPGQQVLIGVGGLASTNAANTGTLTSGQYLVWGDNGLSKTPSVAISGVGVTNYRFAAVWKAQNTGTVGTVRVAWPKMLENLTFIKSSSATFASISGSTPMSLEMNINGIEYNYADVTIANGEYFTFAARLATPGGISANLRVWLKADAGFSPASWTDYSGLSNHYTQTNATRQPFAAAKMYNFNPVVDFGTTGANSRFMVVPSGKPYTANGSNSTIFVTSLNRTTPSYSDIIGFGGTTTTANLTQANSPVFITYGSRLRLYPNSASTAPTIPALQVNRLYLNDMSFTVGTGGIKYGQNGQTQTINSNVTASNAQHANGSILGSQPEARNGLIGEVIAYERDLTEAEKQRVRTYTAIKYGISLPHDYIASDGTTIVWNQTDNTGYNNNIAGLANDEGSSLIQKQSNSINEGQQVLIGTTGLANSNAANPTTLTAGQYLVWGDNGLSKSLGVSHSTTIGSNNINLRFSSVWKVKNTGAASTVRVAWPSGIVNLHLVQSSSATITIAATHTPMAGTITVDGKAYNYADVVLADDSYFTFAGYVSGPGGVSQDLSLWYRADNGVETDADKKVTGWNNSTATDVKLTMSGANAYIPYNDQTTYTKTWNFNPTLSFDGTNNYLRNITTPYINAAASVHYIAVARLNTVGTYNSIFAISGNDDGFFLANSGGNISPMPTINNYVNVAATGPVSTNKFGIFSAILPKSGTTPNQRGFTNGLEKVYTSAYPRTGAAYTLSATPASNNGAFIGADGTTADNPNGDIAEVILYQEPAGGDMTNANLHRIHSYLAIKYGITLDQSSPQNYVNAAGGVLWNATTNAGYDKNIAGIARDDEGALYQKQSNSVNPGYQVLIATTGLENTNANNASALTNGQSLIWGDNNLAKSPSVPFGNIGGLPYQRFAAVWKAQNTNSVGTVRVAWRKGYANLKLIQNNTDATFASGNTVTDMTGTQVVNGVEYAYADVNIANGQYFTFAAFLQAPGGVTTGILMWHKANDGVTASGTKNEWQDVSGNGRDVTQDDDEARRPLLVTDATYSADSKDYFFNFNPFYYFDGGDVLYRANDAYFPASNSPGAVYSVIMNGGGGTRTPYSFSENDNRPSLTRIGTNYHAYVSNLSNFNTTGYNITTLPAHIGAQSWRGSTAGVSLDVNGHTFSSTTLSIAINTTSGSFNIGSQGSTPSEAQLGGMPEVFAYSVDHQNSTGNEKLRINSYLAIKYGITLSNDAGTAAPDYLSSSAAVIYPASTAHRYNIAGIGNDFMSALHQKQSRSVNTNTGQVIIALGDIAETNADNDNELTNGQFLVWGDNNNTQSLTAAYTAFQYAGSTDNGRRMNRIWKIENTGVDQEVLIRFPKTSVGTTTFPTGDPCAEYVIIFASDAAFTTNVEVQGLTDNDPDYDVRHTFPAGASYFTYAKVKPWNQGQVILPPVVETTDIYANTCDIGEWKYFRKMTENTQKLLGVSGYTTVELNSLNITITPEGTQYENGSRRSRLMARITTIENSNAGALSAGKVRVYYSPDEMNAAILPAALTNSWFKYDGVADEVVADIYSDGTFDAGKALRVTPDISGIEDGVYFVEFHNISSFSSFVFLSSTEALSSVLPVTYLYQTAEYNGKEVSVSWATASESNNKGFEVQHSVDGINWSSLGFVKSKANFGNSTEQLKYNFLTKSLVNGKNLYRLKQIDLDGKFTYTMVSIVTVSNGVRIGIFPNPASVNVSIMGLNGQSKISIINLNGQVIKLVNTNGQTVVPIDVSKLPVGLYVIQIEDATGNKQSYKLNKQ